MKQAAIIGGGITGLATAYFLLQKGIKPTIFEKDSQVGGLLDTFKIGDTHLEKFPHHFFPGDDEAVELLAGLKIKKKLFWAKPKLGFSRPLSLMERIRLSWFAKRVRGVQALENVSATEWLEQQLGEGLYKKVWLPLLRTEFGQRAEDLPAASAISLARRSMKKICYLRGSYRVLIDALKLKIKRDGGEIKLNSKIPIQPLPDYDLTIITAPHYFEVPQIEYLGNITVVLSLNKPFSDSYLTNIADPQIPFTKIIEHTNAFNSPAYQKQSLVYLSTYLDQADAAWALSDTQIFDQFIESLMAIKPGFSRKDITAHYVFREKFARPLPTLSYSKKLPDFHVSEGLYLVINSQIYPEGCSINNSIKLAKRFVNQLF